MDLTQRRSTARKQSVITIDSLRPRAFAALRWFSFEFFESREYQFVRHSIYSRTKAVDRSFTSI